MLSGRIRVAATVLAAFCIASAPSGAPASTSRPAPGDARRAASHLTPASAPSVRGRSPWLLFPIDVRRFEHVSSRFGVRRLAGHKGLHRGVDLVAPPGSWVVAAREGRIAESGRARACGYFVTVEHANSWRTVYCHLRSDPRRLGLVQGLRVPAMSVVGEVGSTGHSTGPHLHFSLIDDQGRARDPLLALYTPKETLEMLKKMGLAR